MRSPVTEILADLADGMRVAGAEWYLFGAQAAILHGAARLTADVDVTVRLAPNATVAALVTALEPYGFRLRGAAPDFIERTRVVPMVHVPTSIPVDAILAGTGLEDQFFARLVTRDVDDVAVPVASAEDIVVMKVLAGRDKDFGDASAILAAQMEGLDVDYIRSTLRVLEDALSQSDLLDAFERMVRNRR